MKQVLEFLAELKHNNNREWFELNRTRYREVNAAVEELAQQMIASIGLFDSSIRGLTLKECTYRIYRDMRFSADKTPYKTHIGIYMCPGGKKSNRAGYYLHLEPENSMLVAGLYCPQTKVINSVREDIFSLTAEFEKCVAQVDDMTLSSGNSLKRVPRQFPIDAPCGEYLKLKDVMVECVLSDREVGSAKLLDLVLPRFQSAEPLLRFINRAVGYSDEQN